MFTKAIVRPPAANFSEGLTTAGLGKPDYERALAQHEAYCAALEKCGLSLIKLEIDPDCPDSCFVEDTAVIAFKVESPKNPNAKSETVEAKVAMQAFSPLRSSAKSSASSTFNQMGSCVVL